MSDYYHCENKKPTTTTKKETTTSVSMGETIAFYLVSIVFIAIIVVLFLKVYNKKTQDISDATTTVIGSVIDKYRTLILGSILIFVIFIIIIVSIMYIAPQASKIAKKRK